MDATTTRLYHNREDCTKTCEALRLLREQGIEPEVIDLLHTPLSVAEIHQLLAWLKQPVRELVRTGEGLYAELGLDDERIAEHVLAAALAAHPQLIERPLFVHRGRAVVGRPPARVLEIL